MDFEYFCQELFSDISEDIFDKSYDELNLEQRMWVIDIACDAVDP